MPPIRIYCASQPRARMPRAKIYYASQLPIALAPHHQTTNPEQPAKQELPNTPNLAEPILNQQLVGPGSPQTRSVDLGFEIRGFSCPLHRLSPKNPTQPNSPNRCTKRTQFPPPATVQSPPPPVARHRLSPKRPNPVQIAENRNTKQTHS